MKSFIKRAVAQFLCVAMVLSMCMAFAEAGNANVYEYVYTYNTLNDIPEDVNIFRPIRAGNYQRLEINGEFYYQFRLDGYPIVRLKASAFATAPNNSYLNADNKALSLNCKNKDGASRVCYYKTMTDGWTYILEPSRSSTEAISTHIYTVSIYRLELTANAYDCQDFYLMAKLTSAVTFDYDATRAILNRRTNPIALRPSVSVTMTDHPANTSFTSCKVLEGIGDYSPEVSSAEIASALANTVTCVGSVVAAVKAPSKETIETAVASCAPLVVSALEYSSKSGQYSGGDAGDNDPAKYPYREVIVSPVKLGSYENRVRMKYHVNTCFDRNSTNFLVAFSFT